MSASSKHLTTSNGAPVDNNQTSQTAGVSGPMLLQDFHLIDKISHFDGERIPERVVHAKGAGAHGFFECTSSEIRRYTKAVPFQSKGKRTPVFMRFSTVGGESGSADTARDPRGFSVKFYTEQGNWDMVGNNTPVFFIREPIKFPDFIHTQKRHPQTNLKDSDMFWDFLSLVPESLHQLTILFSDRGIPDGYRFMNGYGSHTFCLQDSTGKIHYCKFHFKSDQGIRCLTDERATTLAGTDPDYATRDLFTAIAKGDFPSWTLKMQIMPVEDASKYKWNILDVTKVWPHKDYPLIEVGRIVLNKNPSNYFAEVEQVAFSPSHLIPGILPSNDRMLQGRLFSYPDTQRHRLGGVNYQQIPINRPLAPVNNHHRGGFSCHNGDSGQLPNYEPNTQTDIAKETTRYGIPFVKETLVGVVDRHAINVTSDDYIQAAKLYKLQSGEARIRLVKNIAESLSQAKPAIRKRQIDHFEKADKNWANQIKMSMLKVRGSKI